MIRNAYRFEEYSMTKQYPKEELAKHVTTNCSIEKRIRLYFYRLANGVPILDEDEPYKVVVVPFTTSLRKQVLKEIQYTPDLVVDSHASALRSHYNQKLVFLRKYKIENYIANC